MTGIRAGRRKPGLLRQHLTAVKAACRISNAHVEGAELGSQEILFRPQGVVAGHYEFAVGTAGSATLVLQTVLPALMLADEPTTIVLEGGTHNPWAPPFEFLHRSFLPCIERMGPKVRCGLERPGFHPAGGGRFTVSVEPCERLSPLTLIERGASGRRYAEALVAHLSPTIGERELDVVSKRLSLPSSETQVRTCDASKGPGNALVVTLEFEHITTVISAIGAKGVRAERVAHDAADAVERYSSCSAPVGPYLADQLLLPIALAGQGAFRTMPLTEHARTNIDVIGQLLGVSITVREHDGLAHVTL